VKRDLERGVKYSVDLGRIQESLYRPFVKRRLYMSREINEMQYQIPDLFGPLAGENRGIAFSAEERVSFGAIALDEIPNKDIFMPSAAQVVCQWRYEGGQRIDNITDWGLDQFKKHYTPGREKAKRPITKDAIFALRLRRASRPRLSREVRAQPEARVPAHPLLPRLLDAGPRGAKS
jgi:predicted helicase